MTDKPATDGIDIFEQQDLEMVWIEPGAAQQNPNNWRRHGDNQLLALADLIYDDDDELADGNSPGTAVPAIINDRKVENGWKKKDAKPTILDGHARDILAEEFDRPFLAMVGSWSPQQEAVILATLDPLVAMATTDDSAFLRILEKVDTNSDPIQRIIDQTADDAGLFQERMQGIGAPNSRAGGSRSALVADLVDDDEFDVEGLLDPKGKVEESYDASSIALQFSGWYVLVTEEERDLLTNAVEEREKKAGMVNGLFREILERLHGDTLENLLTKWGIREDDEGKKDDA